MKRWMILASLCFAALAHADAPTQQSVDELFVVMRTESMVQGLTGNVEQMMRQAVAQATAGKPLTPVQSRTLDAFVTRYAATLRDEISWDKLRPVYEKVYMESFTQGDIDGLIAFYRSPAGQSYLDKMPAVLGKVTAIMQQQMASMLPKMQADLRQAVEDARAVK